MLAAVNIEEALRALTGIDAAGAGSGLRALVLVAIFGLAPSAILLGTCYPRIYIILSFLRRALGTADIPSNGMLAGFALLLTAVTMMPVWKKVHDEAYLPLTRGEATPEEAIGRASEPLRRFMLTHTLEADLRLFIEASGAEAPGPSAASAVGGTGGAGTSGAPAAPEKVEDLGFFVILPAFVLSELRTAFEIGFLLFLPFLVIDLAVSAVLISMGMFMLPPVFVSLPLKVLVFVLADGWNLLVSQIIAGFRVLA